MEFEDGGAFSFVLCVWRRDGLRQPFTESDGSGPGLPQLDLPQPPNDGVAKADLSLIVECVQAPCGRP